MRGAIHLLRATILPLFMAASLHAAPPSLETLFADPAYRSFTISPNGEYFAVITPVEGRDNLLTLKSDHSAIVGRFSFRNSDESVQSYTWLKDQHVLIRPAKLYGWRDAPVWHGELFAARADGYNFRIIYGYRAAGDGRIGTRLKKSRAIAGAGYLINDLSSDPDKILIASYPFIGPESGLPSAHIVSLRDGASKRVLSAPVIDADFIASPRGDIRFATAIDSSDVERVFEYVPGQSEWQEIASNSIKNGAEMKPVGMSADGRMVFYLSDADTSTTGLYAFDTIERQHKLLYRHETDNVGEVELDPWTGEVLWVTHASDHSVHILAPAHQLAKAHKSISKAFSGSYVSFTSVTRDYKKAIFRVYSDRDPGAWYSFDLEARKANLELEANPNIDPEHMTPMQRISLQARDGLTLQGFYTAQKTKDGKKPPMVLLVHGGPHARDDWEFTPEVQMLASRGYAVLQVNFRGSTGYGREFVRAGRGQWGRAMQDDLTDATHWAIAQGLADPNRICIMGASYGGYASLMGVIREPKLYKCSIDMYGVTDLDAFFNGTDIANHVFGRAYLKDAIGTDRKEWDARSPTKLADQIEVPVLIIAGGKDKRVPVIHSEMMEAALKQAGKPVETLYFDGEVHGFFKLKNRVAAYQKILDFLAKNIGNGEE